MQQSCLSVSAFDFVLSSVLEPGTLVSLMSDKFAAKIPLSLRLVHLHGIKRFMLNPVSPRVSDGHSLYPV
ncbi:hypothetical protein XENTR_v10002972 [Xenopus tropicalis]|nr:hypothetical protein XENTR_v10002972 [Xenopus tropicalis]